MVSVNITAIYIAIPYFYAWCCYLMQDFGMNNNYYSPLDEATISYAKLLEKVSKNILYLSYLPYLAIVESMLHINVIFKEQRRRHLRQC